MMIPEYFLHVYTNSILKSLCWLQVACLNDSDILTLIKVKIPAQQNLLPIFSILAQQNHFILFLLDSVLKFVSDIVKTKDVDEDRDKNINWIVL